MNLTFLSLALGVVLVTLVLFYVAQNRRYSSQRYLPPGPCPLPIIGNAHQMPLGYPEKRFAQWKHVYGELIFLRTFNTPMLVVNSAKAARDLLEKRSAKCSDTIGWDGNMALMPNGQQFRKQRRWIQAPFSDKVFLAQFVPVQTREIRTLLSELLHHPGNFPKHFHRVVSADDEYLQLVDKAATGIMAASAPSTAVVDFIPFLQYIPAWLPGAGWKRLALEAGAALKEAYVRTYALAEKDTDGKSSVIRTLIKEYSDKGELATQAYEIMVLGSVAYVAGADTTKTVLQSFVLAMVLHPEVCTKAQYEMDRVVGRERLPTFDDRDSLPYLECVLKEKYRWACPARLGSPHASSEDDEYRGYYIPKGTVVIPNLWLVLRDSEDYPEPDLFLPERFCELSIEEFERTDPRNIVFGHGRRLCLRICPGRRFADTSVWLAMANLVATMNIDKARDDMGNEITPPAAFESGFTSPPSRFQCSIKLQSPQAVELISSVM